MKILSIDTALGKASVNIYNKSSDKIISSKILQEYSMQAEKLFGLLSECLSDVDLDYENIDAYASCIGPGSFTGLRIGMSAAKGLAYARQKPFYGITSLEALKQKADEIEGTKITDLSCAISAGRGQVYLKNFSHNYMEDIKAVNFEDVTQEAKSKIVCNCYDELKKYVSEDKFLLKENVDYNADNIARVNLDSAQQENINRNEPVYVRPPDAKSSNIKRRVIFST